MIETDLFEFAYGTEHQYVCEDQKAEIQTKYLEALSKCKVIR